jgi:CRP/FNR family cyclic AMP-dependent transcriptional regulator
MSHKPHLVGVAARPRQRVAAELGLDRETADALLAVATVRHFRRGAAVYPQGTHRNTLFIVLAGTVSVSVALASGRRVLCAFYRAGAMFGFPLVDFERPRLSAADAFTDVAVAVIPRREFERVLAGLPASTAIRFFNRLLERQARFAMRLVHCTALDLPGRLALTLTDLAASLGVEATDGLHIDVPLTHENLADMVGASRERVSRAMAALLQRGLIRYRRARITVLDLAALRQTANVE